MEHKENLDRCNYREPVRVEGDDLAKAVAEINPSAGSGDDGGETGLRDFSRQSAVSNDRHLFPGSRRSAGFLTAA